MYQNQYFFPPPWFFQPAPPVYVPVGSASRSEDNDVIINTGGQGPPGPPGVSVTDAKVDPNPGNLIITLSDGTEIDAGNVLGPQGDTGPQGPPGPVGPSGVCDCTAILVDKDYLVKETDCYIGVNSTKATNIILPTTAQNGKKFIIKAEMGPPLGPRKVTVKGNGNLIDGSANKILENAYECITVIFRDENWNVVSWYK